ncbi:hypothetical protein G647_06038 [Cladophialophora carrionii CBS 160.54]|uniref:Uncharacterized protein n=1 Tax=Cladophialophora carrionii CBS 160.54 TaxID=1279043 RepID=V9D6R1_9EURO|nr:uncharacterized protein G647_06038 [Cladophialophora carrionii CBS 160.54]ETI21968.1 hypothetical protein G647_06038 [Cladophialophora carrionii CBS 160.54]
MKILLQACLVMLLSITALFSGPIARYSTNTSHQVVVQPVSGFVAERGTRALLHATVVWNQTLTSLEQAGFPLDQLLDYLPDSHVHWVYDPKQWNSTWSLRCNNTEKTPIKLEDSGNCDTILDELPGLRDVISPLKYSPENISAWWGGEQNYDQNLNTDTLLTLGAAKVTRSDGTSGVPQELDIDLAAIYLHNLGIQEDFDSFCQFGKGPVESASYTKIACTATRHDPDPELTDIAFPDSPDPQVVSRAVVQFYQARFCSESIRTGNITAIPPRDLTRFLQMWIATKDTRYETVASRNISVRVPVVQVSVAFLAVVIFVFLLITAALVIYTVTYMRNRKMFEETPYSKLDWMLKVIQATSGRDRDASLLSASDTQDSLKPLKRSRTSRIMSVASSMQEKLQRRRSDFETARYSSAGPSLEELSTDAFTRAPHAPAMYHPTPAEWQLPPLRFESAPKKPASSIYTSISEVQSWRTDDEGEGLVYKCN